MQIYILENQKLRFYGNNGKEEHNQTNFPVLVLLKKCPIFFANFASRRYLHPPFETVITKHECVIEDGDGI